MLTRLLRGIALPWKIAAAALLACGLSVALLIAALNPGKTVTVTHTKTKTHVDEASRHIMDERQHIIDEQAAKIRVLSKANVTRHEVIETKRYPAPPPAAPAGAPRTGAADPSFIPVPALVPYEVVTHTIDTTDLSTRDAMGDTTRKVDATVDKHDDTTTHKTTDMTVDMKTTTTVTGAGGGGGKGGDDKPHKLGFSIQAGAKDGPGLAVKYDLIHVRGPRLLRLQNFFAAAGLGVEKKGANDQFDLKHLDVTPYAGIGYKRISLDLGYRVFGQEPTIGLNYRVGF